MRAFFSQDAASSKLNANNIQAGVGVWNGASSGKGKKESMKREKQKGTTKNNGHMKGQMENHYSRHNPSSKHPLPPNETSSVSNGLYIIELLAKETPWKPLNNTGYCQGYWLLLRTDNKSLLMKRTFKNLLTTEKLRQYLPRPFTST